MNSYNTNISNIYIEDFKTYAIQLTRSQLNINVNNVNVSVSSDTVTSIFEINKGSSVSIAPMVNINNVNVYDKNNNISYAIFGGDGTTVNISSSNIKCNSNLYSLCTSNVASFVKNTDMCNTKLPLTDDNNMLRHNGNLIPKYYSKKISGNGEQTVVVNLPTFKDYSKAIANISIHTSGYDDGAKRCTYISQVYISRKTTTSEVYNTIITNTGFTVEPTISFNNSDSTLSITFTPTNTDERGIAIVEYMYHH